MPYELYRELVQIAEERDCTLSQALEFYLERMRREIAEEYEKKIQELKTAYEAKIQDLTQKANTPRKYEIGRCAKCGKPLVWSMENTKDRKLLEEAVNEAGFVHGSCK